MNKEIEKSVSICIDAINGKKSDNNDTFVLATLKILSQEPYRGNGLGIGCGKHGFRGYRTSWKDLIMRLLGKDKLQHSLDWEKALLVIFHSENLSSEVMYSYARLIEDAIIYNHVLLHIIEDMVAMDKISEAKNYIPFFKTTYIFKEENNQEDGYRVILRYYAQKGNVDEFFKVFKLCEPRKERYEIETYKGILVESVCAQHGIEAAIAVCKHKNIGERYWINALDILTDQGEYRKLKSIFSQYPELKQPEKETELKALTRAYLEAIRQKEETDDDFEVLFQRADKVDPKLKWGDFRLRDSILFDLGLASKGDQERTTRCRKAIKNNSIKKELNDMLSQR